MEGISRRQFLGSAALSAVGLTAGGVLAGTAFAADAASTSASASGSASASASAGVSASAGASASAGTSGSAAADTTLYAPLYDDGTWDEEADIVIIGGGGAGLAAAVAAGQEGASVIVIEVADAVGGNTKNSSGVIQAAGTDLQMSYTDVKDDTPDLHAQYYIECGQGSVDEDLVKYACQMAPSCIDFMEDLGVKYEVVYGNGVVPFVSTECQKPRIHLAGTSDDGLMYGMWHVDCLDKAAQAAGVEYVLGTAATNLIINTDGVVTGALAGGKRYHGKKGTVIATCSYDRNEEMAKIFSQHMLWALQDGKAITIATNTGDGIKLGMGVGADLAGLGGFIGLSNNIGGTPTLPGVPEVPGIIVNKYGRRFVSESDHYAWVLRQIFTQEEHIAWGVFDANVAALGGAVVGGVSPFSDDFSDEIAAGTVFKADTIEDLAKQIDVPAANLQAALDTWNADMAADGKDSQFPTRACGLVALETPPYYATRMYDSNLGAIGGLKINTDAQVINICGQPIQHLFAAGQVIGGFMGNFYPGTGTGVLSTLVWGRTAAASALKQEDI